MLEDCTIIPNMDAQMIETLAAENRIGLAANQSGGDCNLLVIDTRDYREEGVDAYTFVNVKYYKVKARSLWKKAV